MPDLRWPDFSDYRDDAKKLYEGYSYSLPWLQDMQPTPQAQAMIAILQGAGDKGLSPEDYDASRWSGRLSQLRPATPDPKESDLVQFDVALTISAMRYVSDLHVGKINPRHLDFEVDVSQRRFDLPEFLRDKVIHASNVPGALQSVEPPYPGYQRTLRALKDYREMAQADDGESLPPASHPVKPGDVYPRVPRLARLLRLTGDLPKDAVSPPGTTYKGALIDAVKSFQSRNGLTPDGRIDSATLAEMNVPLSRRVRQMELTLERWRWLPDEYAHSPIVVNIPEFRLRAYDDRFNIGVTMKVVVGKVYGQHETPIFMSTMRSVIFRPYWSVPISIAKAEVIPALKKDSGYLAKENMEVVDSRGNAVDSGSVTDEMFRDVLSGKLSFRQLPGPMNSLGLIKFLFPNEFDVYMHDTPATELFSRSRRDFSHGCIRLEKPADLALWVLRNNPGWDEDQIRAAMNGTTTQEVTLRHPINVLIVYGTVIVSEDGVVHFYDDIYGHDATLEQALEKGYPYPR
ncbi:MAG TPA: L,D-transpeptidase family protein [Candidatus Aquilonibacter sp.]|nr:L,D-transpeptidase family protein [Candidatus Aquilonibacter sp.]